MILNNIDDLIQISESLKNNIKIYDKVKYHFPDGTAKSLKAGSLHIYQMFEYLKSKNMLSDIGKQEISLPISQDTILSSDMVNKKGKIFLDKHYDNYLKNVKYDTPSNLIFESQTLYKHSKKVGTTMGSVIGAISGGLTGLASANSYGEDPLNYALGGAALGGLTGSLSGKIQGHFAGKEIQKDPTDKYAGSYGILKSVPLTAPLIAAGTLAIPSYLAKHHNSINLPKLPDGTLDQTNKAVSDFYNGVHNSLQNIDNPEELAKFATTGLATGAIAAIPTGIYHRYLAHKSANKKIKTENDPLFGGGYR